MLLSQKLLAAILLSSVLWY